MFDFSYLGIIHGDFNEQNILVKRSQDGTVEIAGILDFQDAVYGARVYDVAIYMMYMMITGDNPMDIGGHCLRGYTDTWKLSKQELDVLHCCVAGRFVTSLVLGLYNYSLNDDPYLLVTQKNGWKVCMELWSRPSEELLSYWLSDKFDKRQ